jgi:hypothetical protein
VAFQAELGVVGTTLFILFLSGIHKNIRSFDSGQTKEKAWAMAMLLYVVIGAMTNSLHYGKFFWFALALLLAFTSQVESHPGIPVLNVGRGRYLTVGGGLHD